MHEDAERARSALSFLSPDCDRETWVKWAMCIKHEFGDDGFSVWDEWSSSGQNYNAMAARSTWKSVKADGKLTFATLIYNAKQAGWKDDAKRKKPTAEEIAARKKAHEERERQAREQQAALHEQMSARAVAIWGDAKPCADDGHPYLVKKGVRSHGLRVGRWEVLDEQTGEWVTATSKALLIPIMDRKRRIWSLQAIYPGSESKKLYLRDGAKNSNFFAIGSAPKKTEDGRLVFVLGEGYATCASAHEATGHMVLVCFDVYGIRTVARELRETRPDAEIILLADNDTETEASTGKNPGMAMCASLSKEIGALVAVPPPGDFNDLHQANGLDAVAEAVLAARVAPPAPDPAPAPAPAQEPAADAPWDPLPDGVDDVPISFDEPAADVAPSIPKDNVLPDLDAVDPSSYFTVLGYDRGTYFVFLHETRQIDHFTPGEISEARLLSMAPLEWWEEHFPGSNGMSRKLVLNWFFRLAHGRGIYDASRIRGRGAWHDDGRSVYHQGSCLYVDGVVTDVTSIKSRFVYELAKGQSKPSSLALSDEDGASLLGVAKMFRWSKPGAAALLAGWTFLAPICGAIQWRPHIWITGGAGTGKSTVLNGYVSVLVGEAKVFAQGNSTESGIRQRLKADALPVLFDESEQNDESEKRRMAPILALIRQASTESVAQTLKGTITGDAMNFHIRSMFCLASIQAGLENKADQDRLTKLSLLKGDDGDPGAAAEWAKIKEALYKIGRDKDLPGRLLRRGIDMLPVIQKSITVFVEVAAKRFGTQRMGDQYGTMLAGAWCLCNSTVATREQAAAMVAAHDWAEFTEGSEIDDPEKALGCILEAKVQHKGESISVGTIIAVASGDTVSGLTLDDKTATRILGENGIKIKNGHLLFASTSSSLRKLVTGTQFEADLRGQLRRLNGAKIADKSERFTATAVHRAISIPLGQVLDFGAPI
jgi:putative DNA primase/helicase